MVASCSPRQVDPCDEQLDPSGCIAVQLGGNVGVLSRLFLAERGAWTGSTEVNPGSAFELPLAVAVAVPPFVSGTELIEISAYADQALSGTALVEIVDLFPGQHRLVSTLMTAPTPDGGTQD
jgi:hypothetical protein